MGTWRCCRKIRMGGKHWRASWPTPAAIAHHRREDPLKQYDYQSLAAPHFDLSGEPVAFVKGRRAGLRRRQWSVFGG